MWLIKLFVEGVKTKSQSLCQGGGEVVSALLCFPKADLPGGNADKYSHEKMVYFVEEGQRLADAAWGHCGGNTISTLYDKIPQVRIRIEWRSHVVQSYCFTKEKTPARE